MVLCINRKTISQQTILNLNVPGLRLSVMQWRYQLLDTNLHESGFQLLQYFWFKVCFSVELSLYMWCKLN